MSGLTYFYLWAQSNGIELLVYVPLLRARKLSLFDRIMFFSICNALTHPIVFFAFMASRLSLLNSILFAELFAILAETLLIFYFYPKDIFLKKVSFRKAFLVAFLANLLSWQLAPMLTWAYVKVSGS